MTFQRAVLEVESGKGLVNIVFRATNLELESRLRPIRIPLDKGYWRPNVSGRLKHRLAWTKSRRCLSFRHSPSVKAQAGAT